MSIQLKQRPIAEGTMKELDEIEDEYGDSFWDDLDPSDREGWEHNIIKSFDE